MYFIGNTSFVSISRAMRPKDAASARPRLAMTAVRGLMVSALAVLAVVSVPAERAAAQGYYSYEDGYGGGPYKPRKAKRDRARASESADRGRRSAKAEKSDKPDKAEKKAAQAPASTGPLVISVSLDRQHLRVFDANGQIAESPISSGRVGHSTPTGVFSVIGKERMHHSNLYSGAPMPFMQRITWSGVALHAGQLPGFPASHGCIRLPYGFAQRLYGMTAMGARVIVSRAAVVPESFSHPRLFAAYPPESELKAAATPTATMVADATGTAVGTVSEALGVAPALSYRERRAAEAARIDAALRDAGYKKRAAEVLLAAANKTAREVNVPYLGKRAEVSRLEVALRRAEMARDAAKDELDRFNRKFGTASDAKVADKLAVLEAKVASLSDAADVARDAALQAKQDLDAMSGAATEADQRRRVALTAYSEADAALSAARDGERAAKLREEKRALPVSVFVSRATQRLYVRQGWTPIFDVPVTIDRPEEALGTHVFTANAFAPDKTAMEWSVVTFPAGGKADRDRKGRKSREANVEARPVAQPSPGAALDRITIPAEAREQIADVMKPGSSLIVSDAGLSGETGEYTDFVVQPR